MKRKGPYREDKETCDLAVDVRLASVLMRSCDDSLVTGREGA